MEELLADVDDTLVVVAQSNVKCATKWCHYVFTEAQHGFNFSKYSHELNTCAGSMFSHCLLCYSWPHQFMPRSFIAPCANTQAPMVNSIPSSSSQMPHVYLLVL